MVTLTTVATWPRDTCTSEPVHAPFMGSSPPAWPLGANLNPWSPQMNWNLVFVIALIVLVLIYMGSGPHYGTFTSAHFRAGRF